MRQLPLLATLCAAAPLAWGGPVQAQSQQFPPSGDFNGMAISYAVSGASVTSVGDPGINFTWVRSVSGTLGSGQLRVVGVAKSYGIPDYPTDVVVRVWVGDSAKDVKGRIAGDPTINPRPQFPFAFDVAVDIPAGATEGGFSIDMTGYYNVGPRGLGVSGTFTASAAAPSPPAPAAAPPAAAAPATPHGTHDEAADAVGEFIRSFDDACFKKSKAVSLGDPAKFRSALSPTDLTIEDGTAVATAWFMAHGANATTLVNRGLVGPRNDVMLLPFSIPVAGGDAALTLNQKETIWHETMHRIESLHGFFNDPAYTADKVYKERNAAYMDGLVRELETLRQIEGRLRDGDADQKEQARWELESVRDRFGRLEAGQATRDAYAGKLDPTDRKDWPPDLGALKSWAGISVRWKDILEVYASGACQNPLLEAFAKDELARASAQGGQAQPTATPSSPASAAPPPGAGGDVLGAVQLYEAGRYAEAARAFTQAIEANPNSAEAFAGRALARRGLNDDAGASADIDRALGLDPKSADAYRARSMVRRAQNNFQSALADANRAVELAPSNHRAYLTRGLARQALKDMEGAVRDFDRAIGIAPAYAMGYAYRGRARLDGGDNSGALSDFDRFIALDSTRSFAFVNRGLAKDRLGDARGALADYERALAIDPANDTAKKNLAGLTAEVRRAGAVEAAPGAPPAGAPSSPSRCDAPSLVFGNNNPQTVHNGPTQPTVFRIGTPTFLTEIMTYHWNEGHGTTRPGSLSLRDSNGITFGSWAAAGRPGSGGAPNAYWVAAPAVVIPAGTYTIVDSEPASWARNLQSGAAGIAEVKGCPEASTGPVEVPASEAGAHEDSGNYVNRLEFGTGIGSTGYDLVGKSDRFSLAATDGGTIYFRLETVADLARKTERFYIRTGAGSTSAPYDQKDFQCGCAEGGSFSHHLLVPVRVNPAGTYEVRAYLVERAGPDIGKETLVATALLYITP